MGKSWRVVLGAMACLVPSAAAEAQPAKPCTGPEHRQFDFWLGDWDVTLPDGKMAGQNRITSILGGCVLLENWTGATGSEGSSHNLYSAEDGKWHQAWVDNSGGLLLLAGGLKDGKMVLSGTTRGADGKTALNEISWQRLDGGKIRQVLAGLGRRRQDLEGRVRRHLRAEALTSSPSWRTAAGSCWVTTRAEPATPARQQKVA